MIQNQYISILKISRKWRKRVRVIIQKSLGLSKYSRSTNLLHALNISKIYDIITRNSVSLWNRIFNVNSATRTVCSYLYSMYIQCGKIYQVLYLVDLSVIIYHHLPVS